MGSNSKPETSGRTATVSLFRNDLEAVFLRRPNRFLIIAGQGNQEIPCHCPNPGRMTEMFFPGERLILEKRPCTPFTKNAKTLYTAAGIYYHDSVVPLVSARANRAAEALILDKIIPGLREIHGEFTLAGSRFDFLCIDKEGRRHLVEVKACSLVEHETAMFPDAPSGRALKHLEELAVLGGQGYQCHVLFVIVHGKARVFIPNLHTDPELAAALGRYGKTADQGGAEPPVKIHAALIHCDKDGNAGLIKASVPVDLSYGEIAEKNSGSYLIILELAEEAEISVGSLGPMTFKAGWYVYAGSALKNLSQRLGRHVRKVRKQRRWHLDYLTPHAKTLSALPVRSSLNLECGLASALKSIGGKGKKGFGCSDCRARSGKKCESHLYYFTSNPMENRAFTEILFKFRHIDGLRKGI